MFLRSEAPNFAQSEVLSQRREERRSTEKEEVAERKVACELQRHNVGSGDNCVSHSSAFAGGLGILAGDHLKSAGDLGAPLAGVGLLYQQEFRSIAKSERRPRFRWAISRLMTCQSSIYRWYFRAHSLKRLERNILGFCGGGPIRESLIGMVEAGEAREKMN